MLAEDTKHPKRQPIVLERRLLIFAFFVFVTDFVPLRTQSPVPIFTWKRDHWPDCSLSLLTLYFLYQVASISPLPLFFSTQLGESLCGFWAVENTWGTEWLDLSPFESLFYPPESPLFPSSLFSSLCNSMNISERSRLWIAHSELIASSLLSPL